MGDTPTTENKAAAFVNRLIDAVFEGGEAAAITLIDAQAPGLLAIPILGWLIKQGISWLDGIASIASQKAATKIVIDIQTKGEMSSVLVTATALQIALQSGNDEDQKFAIQNATTAYARLIHWDGSARPKH